MKRSLHFYKWFVAVVVLICSTTTMSAQTKVTGLSQLKAGSVIKIYPKEGYGTSHYGESKYALACSGYRQPLTSLEKQALETSGLWKMQEMAITILRTTMDAIGRIKELRLQNP